jgi:hypothetical protein
VGLSLADQRTAVARGSAIRFDCTPVGLRQAIPRLRAPFRRTRLTGRSRYEGVALERISYAAGSILTGDRVAHAIVEYARALAKNGDSDSVRFPVLLASGDVGSAEMLIGPASQVLAVPEHTDHDEIIDEDFVEALGLKTQAIGMPRAVTESPDDLEGYPSDF